MIRWRLVRRSIGFWVGLLLSFVAVPAMAGVSSLGKNGIDALRLHEAPYNLTGRKIAIGQIEIGRPARFGLDKAAAKNQVVRVDRLFYQNEPASPNRYVDEHAARVASIMISKDKSRSGIAPDAVLYASAIGPQRADGQPQECLTTQTIAMQNGGDVRAINFSFGESLDQDPRPHAVLDGNALLTQCIDWSSRAHNVLYAISGNQGRGGYPIPTDTFNGMTIASSMPVNGSFSKVDSFSLGSEPIAVVGRDPKTETNVGPRRSVTLVAPGRAIQTIAPNGNPVLPDLGGTSFAAPHVTATVALLQEFGDTRIRKALQLGAGVQQTHWSLDARRAEVMKAVLMNAADKIQDSGDGLRLGMSRTLLDLSNRNWLDSDAYRNPQTPLDAQMGTGHLNAYRAYQQFSPGQWSPDAPVAAIGWDYQTVGISDTVNPPRFRDYVFQQPLQAGSFLSATLVWNRLVTLRDSNGNEQFDLGETFEDKGLNNLDLYLIRAEDTETSKSIGSSVSRVDSIEHLFHQIPETGHYKIRVVYGDRVNEPVQPYALAWWSVPVR